MPIPNIIAIDGPAASGKSTVGERLADHLGYLYFDTGIMYRAVTFAAMQELGQVTDESAVSALAERVQIDIRPSELPDRRTDVLLDGRDVTREIRQRTVEAHVSKVSSYPGVRAAMTRQQRRIGQRGKIVMVGRDIGTVVLPEADLKVYLIASVEERARRRFLDMQKSGQPGTYEDILADLRRRDEIDSTRAVAPLRPAEDAVIINTDGIPVEEVVNMVMALFNNSSVPMGKA